MDLAKLEAQEEVRFEHEHVNPALVNTIDSVARRLIAPAAKARYQAISIRTAVPWWAIAVIHEREASQRFDRSIAQGDPWNQRSVHIPQGRGPFASFEDAAVDALVNCAPHAAAWKDWSIGGTLVLLEQYNGLGYARMNIPSPYIWAGTDQYVHGKYIADGKFDPNAVDHQLGCAGLLARMAALDPSIKLFKKGAAAVIVKNAVPTIVVTAGAEATHQSVNAGASPLTIAIIVIVTVVVAAAVWFGIHWFQKRRQSAVA